MNPPRVALLDRVRSRYGASANILQLNAQVQISGGDLPDSIIVIPAGVKVGEGRFRLETVDGRGPFYVNDAEAIVQAAAAAGRPLPLDVDHNTVWGMGDTRARAQIENLRTTDGGLPIVGTPRWTKIGRDELAGSDAPPYSMLSPVISVDEDMTVTAVHSLALTNNAALVDTPILNSAGEAGPEHDEQTPMDIKQVLSLLPALAALGITSDMTPDQVGASLTDLKAKADRCVELEAEIVKRERNALLDQAQREGRIAPGDREEMYKLEVTNAGLKTVLSKMAPKIEEPGKPAALAGKVRVEHEGKQYDLTKSEHEEWLRYKKAGVNGVSPAHLIKMRDE